MNGYNNDNQKMLFNFEQILHYHVIFILIYMSHMRMSIRRISFIALELDLLHVTSHFKTK